MKKLSVTFLFLISVAVLYSQDVLELIAEKTCECLETIPDTLDQDAFNVKLGLCMIEAAMPYEKELRKTYGIRLENIDTEGERLGRMVGLKLVSICPEGVEKIGKIQRGEVAEEPEEAVVILSVMGEVIAIDDSDFVTFSVKESTGKISKYFWMTLINGDDQIIYNYSSLLGRVVNITFERQEFFDPRIAEYRPFNIIKELILMEEF